MGFARRSGGKMYKPRKQRGPAAKRGSEDGLCPPQRRGYGGSAPIKKEDSK